MSFKGHMEIFHNELYYEYYPHSQSSETLILIHGFLSSTFSYRRLIPLLTKDYHVLSVDLPPFGKSGKSIKYRYSYKNMAASVIELAKLLEIKNFSLIGHSMGGQIALNMAHLRPELVKKIILLGSSGYLERSKKSLIRLSYLPFFPFFAKRYLAKSGVLKNLQLVVHDQRLIDEEMYQGYMEPFLDDRIFKGLTRLLQHREGDLPSSSLQKIATPCLLIWGEHDKVVPLHIGKRLHQDLPHSQLVVLKDTGHLIPEERPEEVYSHIQRFLKEKNPKRDEDNLNGGNRVD